MEHYHSHVSQLRRDHSGSLIDRGTNRGYVGYNTGPCFLSSSNHIIYSWSPGTTLFVRSNAQLSISKRLMTMVIYVPVLLPKTLQSSPMSCNKLQYPSQRKALAQTVFTAQDLGMARLRLRPYSSFILGPGMMRAHLASSGLDFLCNSEWSDLKSGPCSM